MSDFKGNIENLKGLAHAILSRHGAFLVDFGLKQQRGSKIIEIFADTDSGITTAECATVSREMARELDANDLLEPEYQLVVSSPGVDRSLELLRQYPRHIGRVMKIAFRRGEETVRFEGILSAVEGETVLFTKDAEEEIKVPFIDIIDARAKLKW